MASKEADEEKSLRLQINFLTNLINKHKQKEAFVNDKKNFKYVNPASTKGIVKYPPLSNPKLYKLNHLQNKEALKKTDTSMSLQSPYNKNISNPSIINQYSIKRTQTQTIFKEGQKKYQAKNPYSLVNFSHNVDNKTSEKSLAFQSNLFTKTNLKESDPAVTSNQLSASLGFSSDKACCFSEKKPSNSKILQKSSQCFLKNLYLKTNINSSDHVITMNSRIANQSLLPKIQHSVTSNLPLKQLTRYKLVKSNFSSKRKINAPLVKAKTLVHPKKTILQSNIISPRRRAGQFMISQSTCTSPKLIKLSRHRMVRLNMPSKVIRKVNCYKLEQKVTILPLSTNRLSNITERKKSRSDFALRHSWNKANFLTNPAPAILHSKYVINRLKKTPVRKFNTPLKNSDKMIVIGGLLYNCSRNKLSRAKQTIQNKKNQWIVKNWNPKKARTIIVRGIKFEVDPSGRSLHKISPLGSKNVQSCSNLSRVDLGGITYVQKQPGVFIKSSVGYTRTLANRAISRSISLVQAAKLKKNKQFCMFFNRFGKCNKQNECPYIHDPDKIAVCTRFLRGTCHQKNCPFSHKIAKEKMPVCSFFLRGICNKDDCPYLHSNAGPDAAVCKDFLKGYCSQGEKCKKKHVLVCEEFEKTGKCKHGKSCPLAFQRKKSKKRKPIPLSVPVSLVSTESSKKISSEIITPEKLNSKTKQLPSFISLANISVKELDNPNISSANESEKMLKIRPQFLKL